MASIPTVSKESSRRGGISNPPNSYTIPSPFPLEPKLLITGGYVLECKEMALPQRGRLQARSVRYKPVTNHIDASHSGVL